MPLEPPHEDIGAPGSQQPDPWRVGRRRRLLAAAPAQGGQGGRRRVQDQAADPARAPVPPLHRRIEFRAPGGHCHHRSVEAPGGADTVTPSEASAPANRAAVAQWVHPGDEVGTQQPGTAARHEPGRVEAGTGQGRFEAFAGRAGLPGSGSRRRGPRVPTQGRVEGRPRLAAARGQGQHAGCRARAQDAVPLELPFFHAIPFAWQSPGAEHGSPSEATAGAETKAVESMTQRVDSGFQQQGASADQRQPDER